jgi:hypothetical protein
MAYLVMNLHPLMRLLSLWFESIPGIIQGAENAISNHPLLQRSLLNIELQKNNNGESVRHPGKS